MTTKNDAATCYRNKWAWWAGRHDEWMTVGPCETREEAIAEALDDIGEGEGDFIIIEAIMHEISISADSVIDRCYEEWADGGMFSQEHDGLEPQGSKEDQKAAEVDLQAALDAWVAKWRHTLPTPNMFAAQRNNETILNDDSRDLAETAP